jgi:hypothetical protein
LDWKNIKQHAEPGDILLLRRDLPEGKPRGCLVKLIHELDGDYDHAALVTKNDPRGTVRITHAQATNPAVKEGLLDDELLRDHDGVKAPNWVRAELRRHSPDGQSLNGFAGKILNRALLTKWPASHYAFGDLLLAALAASSDRPTKLDPRVAAVLRSRVLALCIVVLQNERDLNTAAVTCASFVNLCHDEENELAGPFLTIKDRIDELQQSMGADLEVDMAEFIKGWNRRYDEKELYDLMDSTLCPHSVADDEDAPPPELVAHLRIDFLREVEGLHMTELVRERADGGSEVELVRDADRLLVTVEDLHTDEHLSLVCVEPPGSCACDRPPQATSPVDGHHKSKQFKL